METAPEGVTVCPALRRFAKSVNRWIDDSSGSLIVGERRGAFEAESPDREIRETLGT
jgi:hypothetical protein